MKKELILSLSILICTSLFSQNGRSNKIGGYLMGSNTAVHNLANKTAGDVYSHELTFSWGAGAYFTHFLKGKQTGNKMTGGRFSHMNVGRWAIRAGAMYSHHKQKFTSTNLVINGESYPDQTGTKNLKYLKTGVYIQRSRPFFHSKKMSFIWFVGPQITRLLSSRGGLVTWRFSPDGDYYDLPEEETGGGHSYAYYKRFNLEIAAGMGIEYHLSRFMNLTFTAYGDWSVTSIDKADAYFWNKDPNWTSVEKRGIYDRFDEKRQNSRLSTHGVLIGMEYTFHRSEHGRAKF